MYYCDTDSLHTTAHYPTSEELGALSFEGEYEGIFLGNKTYALRNAKGEEKVAFKGFHVQDISYKEVERVLRKREPLVQTRQRILSFKECLHRKEGITSSAGPFLKMVSMTKHTEGLNDKRELLPSTAHVYDSRPFRMEFL